MGVARQANFASKPHRPVRLVAVLVWCFALLLWLFLVWSVSLSSNLRNERDQFTKHQSRLTEEVAALRELAIGAPTANDLAILGARTRDLNALTGPRAMPLTDFLAFLEDALPQDVRVSQLVYDSENGRVSIALQALNEASLPPALRTLEASPYLQDVILERQLRVQQGSRRLAQYDIRAVAP